MAGWIKVHREIMSHWVADEPEALAVFLRLLCEANFADAKRNLNGRPTTVMRGQLVFGYPSFSARSGVSVAKLRRILRSLKGDGMIDRQNFSKFSIITIVNYEDFQGDDRQNAGRTQAERRHVTTLEEEEEGKNNNNPSSSSDDERAEEKSRLPNCPHAAILAQWETAMPDKRQVIRSTWKPGRKEYAWLAARWKEGFTLTKTNGEPLYTDKESGIEWWGKLFRYLRKSEFLMDDGNNWFDLGWVVSKDKFTKILENKYHGDE